MWVRFRCCAMPKSTCQTSPRLGSMRFLLIQHPEGLGSKGCEVIVTQIIAHGDGFSDGVVQFQPFGHWKLFDGVEEM